ncbi:restriction endonuclease subunit S [Yersinia enterocolitica]|uniref:restriction endonuclease subunit S n=1 Tax=Yersinia enterocolitica TaxID=630 RepID=UPI00330F58ED|nr:restriction endonuclease subunit S [Yersinia enterocolitica]
MSMDSKVPEIRFKGFSGEWDYLTLGENATFTKGQGYSKGDLVTSGSPIILYGRLYTKYQTVITGVDTFVTEKDNSVKSIGGEVIVPASGESPEDISRASVVSEPNVILGGDLNIVLPRKKIHSTFLALAISNGRLKKKLSSKAQGKSVVHIRNSDLADLDLILPTEYIEQIAIGNYFQKLDTLINQHQQKHDKLSNIKKAMLEKMLPKQGETIPEIRFKGFSGEWEEVTLSSVIDVRSGKDYKHLGKGHIPVYGTGGYMHSVDSALSNDKDAIGIGRKGTIDKPYILRAPFWTVDTLFYAVPFTSFNLDFLFCLFQKIDWKKHDESTGVPSLSKIAINNLPVYTTNELEQTAIGNYFQKLDALINQHQQQITKLNNIKQACLSKMFI